MNKRQIKRIAKKNPRVDVSEVQRALENIKQLRSTGVIKETKYNIVSPYSGSPPREVAPQDEEGIPAVSAMRR